ncbi:MAG: TOBE domain-containing protein, partial [Geminicoccaceae bacterium]|nr:TOBE domain-containing protein [Geminicoccaceae bacterium]
TAFVASFVGESNPLPCRVRESGGGTALLDTPLGPLLARDPRGLPPGSPAILIVRPERCRLDGTDAGEGRLNRIPGRLERIDFEGAYANLVVATTAGTPILVYLPNDGRLAGLLPEAAVTVAFPPEAALALPEGPLARG